MNGGKRVAGLACLAATDAVALVALWPNWRHLGRDLGAPRRWLEQVGADQAAIVLAAAALWCVALWLAIGLSAAVLAAIPGRIGDLGGVVANRLLPAVLLRAVAGIAGLGVLVAPVAAGAKATSGGSGPAGVSASATSPAPKWPTDPDPQLHLRIGWPTDDAPAPSPTPTAPGTTNPHPARPTPTTPGDAPHQAPQPNRPAPDERTARATDAADVRVAPGDSLWLIAAQRLGPHASDAEIAAAWPRWYAANEQVIGDDPALIHPGQVLHAPDASR